MDLGVFYFSLKPDLKMNASVHTFAFVWSFDGSYFTDMSSIEILTSNVLENSNPPKPYDSQVDPG